VGEEFRDRTAFSRGVIRVVLVSLAHFLPHQRLYQNSYRILLLQTCDDTTYALGLQSFLYHIKCAFFVCAFHRFALILSFFSVLLLLFRLPVVSLASVGALLMMLMIRASSNARERTHDDFFCGRVDVHGFFSSFDFFLFFVVCGCFSSSASCS